MKKPLEEEKTLLQDGTIKTSVVESKDDFLGSIPNNTEIASKGSVGHTPTTTCRETKSDCKLM
jgi:hypothetical protein